MDNLSKHGVLVTLRVSQWSGRTKDADAGHELAGRKDAVSDRVSVNKTLVTDQHRKPIRDVYKETRDLLAKRTAPWNGDGSTRLLPATLLVKTKNRIEAMEAVFWREVDALLDKYDELVEAAKYELGDMFDPADYPSKSDIRRRYGFSVSFEPVPEGFGANMPNEVRDALNEQFAAELEHRAKRATDSVVERISAVMDRVLKVANDERPKIYDSLAAELVDLAEVGSDLNFSGDSRVTEALAKIKQDLARYETEDLRTSAANRADAGVAAQDVLSTLGGLL